MHCGNHEIHAQVRDLNPLAQILWSPGLILDERVFAPAEISVFSFGMAHKIRTDLFRRLRDLLDASGRSYAVYVSAANHETTRMRDAQLIFDELHEIFPTLFFLGNLSDVAVFNYLRSSTFFASFFLGGVRANNGSVAAAMEKGAVVITNLDEHSPPELVHMDNVIDIGRCERAPARPARAGADQRARDGDGPRAAAGTSSSRGWRGRCRPDASEHQIPLAVSGFEQAGAVQQARRAGAAAASARRRRARTRSGLQALVPARRGTGRSGTRASRRAVRSPGRSRGPRRARAARGGRR